MPSSTTSYPSNSTHSDAHLMAITSVIEPPCRRRGRINSFLVPMEWFSGSVYLHAILHEHHVFELKERQPVARISHVHFRPTSGTVALTQEAQVAKTKKEPTAVKSLLVLRKLFI